MLIIDRNVGAEGARRYKAEAENSLSKAAVDMKGCIEYIMKRGGLARKGVLFWIGCIVLGNKHSKHRDVGFG